MEAVGSGQRSAMIVWPDLPFTSHTARSLGASPDQLTEAVANSELVRVLTGVYLRADIPLDLVAKSRCAALVVTPHSVLCDRTAAWIHGIDVLRYAELDVVPPVESYVLRGHHPTDRSECAGGTRDLLPEDWMDVHGLRVTTPLRTALDLACKLPRREALAALDAFVRTHGITHRDLHVLLRRYRRRRGVVQARTLVPLADGRSESPGETWTRLEIKDRGLPSPTPQYWVLVRGIPTYRLDLAYPHARIAIEYDGEAFHSSQSDRDRDAIRRSWLRAQGWHVIVLTKASFTPEECDRWIEDLRSRLPR